MKQMSVKDLIEELENLPNKAKENCKVFIKVGYDDHPVINVKSTHPEKVIIEVGKYDLKGDLL